MTLPRSRTTSRSRGRERSRILPALLALFACACAAPKSGGGAGAAGIDATFLPALETLRQAVEGHENELAESILAGILAREPEGETLELARRFESVLVGRRLVASLDLSLVVEPIVGPFVGSGAGSGVDPAPREPGELRVLLVARHTDERDLTLRFAPASLRRVTTRVGATSEFGLEQSAGASSPVRALEDLELPAGATVVVELGRFASSAGTALAVRDHVVLDPRAGHVIAGGVPYPAQDLHVAPAESVRLAPWLPTAPVSPGELLSYVRRRSVALPPLMERAVRIPPALRDETLDRLTAILDDLGDNRVHEIVPALRWLARTSDPGGSPVAWRHWLEQRRAVAAADRGARSVLDLPEPAAAR